MSTKIIPNLQLSLSSEESKTNNKTFVLQNDPPTGGTGGC